MPTIYTAYFALLPLWPQEPPLPFWPYTPESVHSLVRNNYSPRALLMFALVVSALVVLRNILSHMLAKFTWMCRSVTPACIAEQPPTSS